MAGHLDRLPFHSPATALDVAFSAAVFEQRVIPGLFTEEIAKALQAGSLMLTVSYFNYLAHEGPWHVFQINNAALAFRSDKVGPALLSSQAITPF